MNTNQQIVTAGAIDWTQPVECRFSQLREVIAKADAAGWRPFRMKVIKLGYELQFLRKARVADPVALMV
jgi:hypothetical protein